MVWPIQPDQCVLEVGLVPIFCFWSIFMPREPAELRNLIEPAVTALGYELVGVEFSRNLLRVYIDHEAGISADDCRKVSYQVSGVLDVEDPISGQYSLEISSPGLDRPLFQACDFERFAGQQVTLKLTVPVEGRRKYKGLLVGLDEERVIVNAEGQEFRFLLDQIDQANLVPNY